MCFLQEYWSQGSVTNVFLNTGAKDLSLMCFLQEYWSQGSVTNVFLTGILEPKICH